MNEMSKADRRRVSLLRGGIAVAAAAALITGGALMFGGGHSSSHAAARPAAAGAANGQNVDLQDSPAPQDSSVPLTSTSPEFPASPVKTDGPHAKECADLIATIQGGGDFDPQLASTCDSEEFGGEGISPICEAINGQVATGNRDLSNVSGVELGCQKEEQQNFGFKDFTPTSLCKGAKIASDRGAAVDDTVKTICKLA